MTRALNSLPEGRASSSTRRVDGQRISARFYELLHGRVTEILPILVPGCLYTLEDLCGAAFVAGLPPAKRDAVAPCIVDMTKRGALPMVVVSSGASGDVRFCLKEGA